MSNVFHELWNRDKIYKNREIITFYKWNVWVTEATINVRATEATINIRKYLTPSQYRIITFGYHPLLMRPILIPYSSVDTISPPSQSDSYV